MKRLTLVLIAGVVALGLGRAERAAAQDKGLTFEVYKDKGGEFRWRLKAGNNQVVATSGEGYKAKADAQAMIDKIMKEGAKATLDAKIEKDAIGFEIFKDDKGEMRWRLKAANDKIIAVSGEGYKEKADAEKAITLIKEGAAKAKTLDAEPK